MAYPSLSHPPPPALAPAPVEHVLICRKIVTGVEVLKNLELPVALSSRIRFEAGERDLLIALVNPDNNEVHHLELRKRQEGSHGRPFAKQNSWRQLMLSRQINHGSTMIFRTTNVQNRFLLEVEDAGDSDDEEAGDGVPDDTSDDNPHDSQEQAPNTRGNLLLDPQVRRPFLSGADSSDNIYEGRTFQFEQSDRVLFTFANLLSPHLCGSKFICLDYDKKGLIYDGNIGEKIGELGYCGRPERKVNSQIEGFADAEREIVPYVFFKKIWTALNGDQYEDTYWRYVGIQAKGWGIPIRPSKAVVIETGAALLQGSKVPSTGDHGFLVTAWPITHDTLEEEKVLEKYGVVWDQTSHEIKLNNVRKNCFAWSLTNCMVATGSLDTNKPASHGITIRGAHLGGVYGESRHK